MNIEAELHSLTQVLAFHDIPYAVCGGLAVTLHGCPRSTKDIDILIRESDVERVEKLVAGVGYILTAGIIPFRVGTEKEQRIARVSKAEGEELLTLDLLLVTPILEDVWASREVVQVGGQQMAVVSVAGLIKMKRLAGRLQDLADIERLEELHGK